MAYTELIKSFERIRDYLREFYIYGFRTREEYSRKSSRSYDNERRRIESYLGEHTAYRRSGSGKNVYLSINSRLNGRNPLYKVLRSKSFTDGDITLHFILFDILFSQEVSLTLAQIVERINADYLSCFDEPMSFDDSTVRKKLAEYAKLGLVRMEKHGRQVMYSRSEGEFNCGAEEAEAVQFFSEAALCGAVGSFLLDKLPATLSGDIITFKHHYITHVLESEVLCGLLQAIQQRCGVEFTLRSRRGGETRTWKVVPLKIFVSVQNGRRWAMCYDPRTWEIKAFRLDYMSGVKQGVPCSEFEQLCEDLKQMQPHIWGVSSCRSDRSDEAAKRFDAKTEHVEFTIHIGDDEEFIYNRLVREKRCGTVERIDRNTARFSAEVFDTVEMLPWIRTFICRIVQLDLSNRTAENRLKQGINEMYRMYGIGEEDEHAVP